MKFTFEKGVGIEQDFSARTGVLHQDGDWPGVFIRGDDALRFAAVIHKVLKETTQCRRSAIEAGAADVFLGLEELAELLASCEVPEDDA